MVLDRHTVTKKTFTENHTWWTEWHKWQYTLNLSDSHNSDNIALRYVYTQESGSVHCYNI